MAVATAALEEGLITPQFQVHCSGGANFYGRTFKCWKKGGHGTVNLRQAIEQSCDVFFYTVGNMLGVDRMHKWATSLGLGVKSGIDLPNEVVGIMPSTQWKKAKTGEKWYTGETISVAIGQGQVTVTPVSMAVYMATIANGGTRVTPHLLKAIDQGNGWKPVPPPAPQGLVEMQPDDDPGRARRDVDGRERRGHGQKRAPGRVRCFGQDRDRAGDFARRAEGAARGGRTWTSATTAGSCSSRRATTRRSPASCSPSTASMAPPPRSSLVTSWRRSLRSGTDARCPPSSGRCGPSRRLRHPSRQRSRRARPRRRRASAVRRREPRMIERRLFFYVDWLLLAAVLVLTAIGLAMIYSTTFDALHGARGPQFSHAALRGRHRARRAGGVPRLRLSPPVRVLAAVLRLLVLALVYVLAFGFTAGGARRWIALGRVNLQPSEFAKIGLALVVATFFSENRRGARSWRRSRDGGHLPRRARVPRGARARPRDGGHARADLRGHRLRRGDAREAARRPRAGRAPDGAPRVELRAQGLPEIAHPDVPRPRAGRAGRRVPADPGAHHRRDRAA